MSVATVPNAGSIYSANPGASLLFSINNWAWIGLQTGAASGTATFYHGAACTSGSEIMTISLSSLGNVLYGPFCAPSGLYVAAITGGCAVYWVRKRVA